MIFYKTQAEIAIMRESALMVGKAHAEVVKIMRPGIATARLDKLAHEFILDNGGIPSFKDFNGYPFATCISVNDAIVHGFPNERELKDGDIISLDIGVYKNGYHGDSAYTYAIGEVSKSVLDLMRVTKESLLIGASKAVAGNRVGDISYAIMEHCERKHNYGVVRELVGHGVGKNLHEDPQVPNYGKRGTGAKMMEGLVIAIEPMVNLGVKEVYYDDDGWTVRTKDNLPSAHFEHTVCVAKGRPDILSSFVMIEAAEKANPELNSSYYQ